MAAKFGVHFHQMQLSRSATVSVPGDAPYVRKQPLNRLDIPASIVREAKARQVCAASGGALQPIDWAKVEAEEKALLQKHAKRTGA